MRTRFSTIAMVFCMLLCIAAFAENSEKITMTVGTLKVLDLPFVMENYRPSTRGIIRIENFSERQLRIIAEKQGICELEVTGGGLRKIFSISVIDNISEVLKQLQTDLDSLPELDISINQDYIVIKGEVSNIGNWEHLQKVLSAPNFSGCCRNYAKFRPAPEIMLNLKNLLTQAGYAVVDTPISKEPGDICMQYASNTLTITGNVYNNSDIENINTIISTQPWLTTEKADGSGKVRAIVKLKVIPTTIYVDIVFVALNKSNADKAGSDSVPSITAELSKIYDAVLGRVANNTALLGGNMNSTLQFLASNGVTKMHDAGCVVVRSNDPQGTTQHIGGKTYVKVSGSENGSLQDINYGLNLTVKGGLISKDKVDLQFDLSNTGTVTAGGNDTFDQEQANVKNSVVCELEKTVVLGGYKKIVQATSKSGLPILRNVPVLQWFISKDSENETNQNLIILACPRLNNSNPEPIVIPVLDEVKQETNRVSKDGKTIMKEDKSKDKRWWRIFW